MINRKIAISAVSILGALTLVGGTTFAFFSDAASSNDNLFSSGNLILQLDDANESATETISGSIGGSDLVPGAIMSGHISMHNGGSVAIAETELTPTVTETADPGADSNLADVLLLTVNVDTTLGTNGVCDTPTNLTVAIDTAVGNGNGTLQLSEWAGDTFDAITPGLLTTQTRDLCIAVQMDPNAGNIYQGDAIDVDLTFTGNQDASQ